MDYETRPTSRVEIRLYATAFRKAFGLPLTGPIDPLSLLDKVTIVYGNVDYEVVEQSELPRNVPAKGGNLIWVQVITAALVKQKGQSRK